METSVENLGKLTHAELISLVADLLAEVTQLREENQELRDENQKLKARIKKLEGKSPTPRVDESYSLDAEEKRRENQSSKKKRQQNSKRRGRRTTEEKSDQADLREIALPDGFTLAQCHFVRERVVWRIREGQAVQIVYEIWHGPENQKPNIAGVFSRSEFGIEIQVTVAFLVSMIGLSMDKVCHLLKFFWQLELSKSQSDSLLNQLSSQWEEEFETLCDLLSASAVVHADETSWSIRSVWAFLSEQARVLIFGTHKDGATLGKILPKDSFSGILISDDAAIYQGFSVAQKCWAHLLRKAIKLTLLFPEEEEYRTFLDGLLALYNQAKTYAADESLDDAARQAKVNELDNSLADLLAKYCSEDHEPTFEKLEAFDNDFENLVRELARLMLAEELFTFVLYPAATGTNNEAERTLRGAAMDRRTGQTSKTPKGARRRSILTSVFESLKLHLGSMALKVIVNEVLKWHETGQTLFDRLRIAAGLDPPESNRLPTIVPDLQTA